MQCRILEFWAYLLWWSLMRRSEASEMSGFGNPALVVLEQLLPGHFLKIDLHTGGDQSTSISTSGTSSKTIWTSSRACGETFQDHWSPGTIFKISVNLLKDLCNPSQTTRKRLQELAHGPLDQRRSTHHSTVVQSCVPRASHRAGAVAGTSQGRGAGWV
ncbi:hypothetical protein EYF80_044660 [Liparis tanakae]|uniref:Uncharacterized protein n=1 Tax=Liparis tanakae TaxID=230148 RepID=A0A4Z2FVW7_9TELE|nr:hypothetical protein EYF80_044660 [Liparis tanakae]